MAIQYYGQVTNIRAGSAESCSIARSGVKELLEGLGNFYDWNKYTVSEPLDSSVNVNTIRGDYYFTDQSYLSVIYTPTNNIDSYLRISYRVTTPFASSLFITSNESDYSCLGASKTSSGIALQVYGNQYRPTDDTNWGFTKNMDYNIFISEYETVTGLTGRGLVLVTSPTNDTASSELYYRIFSDHEHNSMSKLRYTIDSTRKADYVPIVSTVTGARFDNIYMMKSSPLNYNVIDINNLIYVCGRSLALAD